ncbi:DivIVA domain-containing protein [Actinomycetospora sp. TBRC 11914]|uniref:DivIVA domain-containing protein n=1 Tax=Actinomycetospora sp. TBRC 11914 TaxID=2729387 RepID=UPI00145E8457|nr:DivIVA domain-containing protein [Actinomycetospora sp. TBRC 11914]NMO88816.1 DivIVA domain-containing protein [Actinomycetospora sp. TBRC 11914]
MGSALVYVLVVGVVAAVVYAATAFLAGRGEELEPMPPGATPTRLPARDLTAVDVRGLRFQQAFRGYRMSEVDWALDRLAAEVDALRARLAVHEGAAPAPPEDDAEPLTDVVGPPSDPSPTDPTAGVATPSGTASSSEGSAHGHA